MAETILLYGNSGSSKTTQCAAFHAYEYALAHSRGVPQTLQQQYNLRYQQWHIFADSGMIPLRDVIGAGQVTPWNLAYEPSLMSAAHEVGRGRVPVHTDITTGRRLSDEWQPMTGSASIEGLTVISQGMKDYMAKGKGLSQEAFVDEGRRIGNAQLQVYNLVFDEMYALIMRLKGIPVPRIMMTAHQVQEAGNPIGPAMVPPKRASSVAPWFEQTLHIEDYEYSTQQGLVKMKVINFEPHTDPVTQAKWPCKTSLLPRQLNALRQFSAQYNGVIPITIDASGQLVGGLPWYLSILDNL